jgi:hypothetical protein
VCIAWALAITARLGCRGVALGWQFPVNKQLANEIISNVSSLQFLGSGTANRGLHGGVITLHVTCRGICADIFSAWLVQHNLHHLTSAVSAVVLGA